MQDRKLAIQTNFTTGEISERMSGRVDQQKYFSGAKVVENLVPTPHGGLYRRQGFQFVHEAKYSDKKCRLERFVFSASQAYVMEWGHNYIRLYLDGGLLTTGSPAVPYEIAHTYTEAQVAQLKFVQSVDVVYIVHNDHPPRKLVRSGHTSWVLSDIDFKWGPFDMENTDKDAKIKYSALTGTGVTMTASGTLSGVAFAPFVATDVGRLMAVRGATKWGTARITAFTSSTVVTVTVLNDFDGVAGTDYIPWRFGTFHSVAGYPSCICFHEDRLVMAGTKKQPQGVFISKSSEYENFDDFDPTQDDTGMNINLVSSDLNMIQWLLSSKVLMAGTVAGEWRIGVLGATSPLTPKTVQAKRETLYGCASVQALQISDAVMFVVRGSHRVREFTYQMFSYSELASKDVTVLAEHIFRDTPLTDWAWQREPDGVLWCTKSDGELAGFTYMKDQEVYAWHRHPMANGLVEDLTVLPMDTKDELWVAVRRSIQGADKVYIERQTTPTTVAAEQFYVDSGLMVKGTAMTLISGLDHLIGQTVSVLADGANHPQRVVNASGQIDLDYPADTVVVGLPMISVLQTIRYEYPNQRGTSQGMLVRVNRIILRLWKAGEGLMVGPSLDKLDRLEIRTTEDKYDTATGLFTGDMVLPFSGGWEREGTIYIVQDTPLPMNLVALIAEVTAVDR